MLDEETFERITKANAFPIYNGIKTRQVADGVAEASLEIGANALNASGLLHGGAYYTLADCACSAACRTDGRRYVTLHGSLDFIRAAKEGRVTARATMEHHGRTTCLLSVSVSGEDGTVYASGRFTFFCVGKL